MAEKNCDQAFETMIFISLLLVLPSHLMGSSIIETKTTLDTNKPHPPTAQTDSNENDCKMTVLNKSAVYFQSQLNAKKPHLVHFYISFDPPRKSNSTTEVFRPDHWVWTYKSSKGLMYLTWNNDYSLLSFGMLDTQTLDSDPELILQLPANCPVTFGDFNTTLNIANAFTNLTTRLHANYEVSYFCFLAEVPRVRSTVAYIAALYFMYPVDFINFNCCYTYYNYVKERNEYNCSQDQIKKLPQFTIGPYMLGMVIFLYFPIVLLKFMSRLDQKVTSREYIGYVVVEDNDWIYLDGTSPLTFFSFVNIIWCNLKKTRPILVSRCVRFSCLLFSPIVVYIQIFWYYTSGSTDLLNELIEQGAPVGFLSLLCDRKNRSNALAPVMGGPVILFMGYFILGTLFLVAPKSLKQIIENGMPSYSGRVTPLCLSASDIRDLSMLNVDANAGFENAASLCRCGTYMIFSKRFWAKVFEIQSERLSRICETRSSVLKRRLKLLVLPIYAIICSIEVILCIVFYGVPFCMFVMIKVRGASKSFMGIRLRFINRFLESSPTLLCLVFNPLSVSLLTVVLYVIFLFYVYAGCLIFIESFTFIAQVLVFTFIAVVLYPAVAFGDIFFCVILIFYIARLIQSFDEVYLQLLSSAVEISQKLDNQETSVTMNNSQLIISNVKEPIVKVFVNGTYLPVEQRDIALACEDAGIDRKIKMKNNAYGIPSKLFDVLIRKHRPLKEHFLKVSFKFFTLLGVIALTWSFMVKYVSGPATGISKVMQVFFVVIFGTTTPHLLELGLTDGKKSVNQEIECKRLERSIKEYWDNQNASNC